MRGKLINPWLALHFLLIFSFVFIRAVLVPIVPDEAFTFFLYVEPETVFYPAAQVDANNHYLNSILSIWSTKLFGLNALSFRLPNVLAFLVYYYSAYKIATFIVQKWKFWVAILAVTSIYPLLEFFSLSRGYGLSFALLLLTIYQSMRYLDDKRNWRAWWILVMIFLTLFAQLSLLFASIALFLITAFSYFKNSWKKSKWSCLAYLFLGIGLLILYTLHIKNLQDGGFLYFGLSDRFPLYNIISLNEILFQSDAIWLYYIGLIAFLIMMSAFPLYFLKNKFQVFTDKSVIFPFVLFVSIAGILAAIFILHGSGPLARTSLYLYLLLVGTWLFMTSAKPWLNYLSATLHLAASLFSFAQVNLKQVNYWENHRVDHEIFDYLMQEYSDEYLVSSSIYIDRNLEMELNYFRKLGKSITIIENDISNYDAVILTPGDVKRFQTELTNFELIYDGDLGVSLYENKKPDNQYFELGTFDIQQGIGNPEYINVSTYQFADSVPNPRVFLLSGTMKSIKSPKTASWNLVVQFFDSSGAYVHARYFPINRFGSAWNKNKLCPFQIPIAEIPENTSEIRIFMYNPLQLNIDEITMQGALKGAF